MRYLVDTDWLIDTMSGQPAAANTLISRSTEGLAVSIITLGELFDGAFSSADVNAHLHEIRELIDSYSVLNLSEAIVLDFSRTRSALRRQGNLIPDLDLLIAATALHYDLILITRNVRHFERIDGLVIYSGNDD